MALTTIAIEQRWHQTVFYRRVGEAPVLFFIYAL